MGVFKVMWLAIKDLFDEFMSLIIINILWLLINAPLIAGSVALLAIGQPLLAIIIAILAVFVFGPANTGLFLVAERVTSGRVFEWRLFFDGFRTYLKSSWILYGIWAIGFVILFSNFNYYASIPSTFGAFLFTLMLYFVLVWLALLIYIGPLLVIQEDKSIKIIYRNAFLLVFGRPIFTAITVIFMGLIWAVSIFMPLLPFLITFSFLAVWGFRATRQLVDEAEARRLEKENQGQTDSEESPKGRGGQVRPRD